MFHEHKQLTEQQMKNRLKEKLDGDDHCVDFLRKSEEKGLTFDDLWNKKMYSVVSTQCSSLYNVILISVLIYLIN